MRTRKCTRPVQMHSWLTRTSCARMITPPLILSERADRALEHPADPDRRQPLQGAANDQTKAYHTARRLPPSWPTIDFASYRPDAKKPFIFIAQDRRQAAVSRDHAVEQAINILKAAASFYAERQTLREIAAAHPIWPGAEPGIGIGIAAG